MVTHNVKLALRNLIKHKSHTLISIFGLAASLAASVVVLTSYFNEISFDKHIPDADRSYRIITRLGEGNFWARTFAAYPDALANSPGLEKLTSFIHATNSLICIGEADFTVSEAVIADTAFIDFFGLELISGRKEDLALPNQVFITLELAEIFFEAEDPLDQEVFLRQIEGNMGDSIGYFSVAGIIKPLPDNSHFGFKMIFSQQGHMAPRLKQLKERKAFGASVYVRLHPGVQVSAVEAALGDLIVPFLESRPGPPLEAFNSKLQAVREIHFTTNINREPRPVTRKSTIYVLFTVGIVILVLMTLNFISTLLVQSKEQKKASEIMRIMGANKVQLFRVSLLKIVLLVGMGLVIGWVTIVLAEPFLKMVLGSDWSFRTLGLSILVLGFGTGIAMVLFSSLGLQLPLWKGNLPGRNKDYIVFGVLTLVQFAIVIVLFAFSMMINKQIRFMDQKDLGYTDENTFIIRIPSQSPRGSLLVEEIRKQSGVISASTAHHHPGDVVQSMDFSSGDRKYQFAFRMVDPGIFETLEIDLVKRFVSPGSKLEGWVINESFYNQLLQDFSPEDVATSNFSSGSEDEDDPNTKFEIAGVMKDFHYNSLHNSIGNFAFVMRDPESNYNRWLMVRFSEGQSEQVLEAIQHMMDKYFFGRALDFFLLEDQLREPYEASRDLSLVIRSFSILSVLIAISGLYGLSLFITRKRTREIGIRKINGAGSRQIIIMLILGFLKWVGLAFLIAAPLTAWILNKWLINFAYKASLPWWGIGLSGILLAAIAALAIYGQASSAARANPVQTLRN